MDVVTSDDGKVRAYIIGKQNYEGNTSAGFETRTLIQYKVDYDIHTTRLDEVFPIVKSIANLSDNYYLIIDCGDSLLRVNTRITGQEYLRLKSRNLKVHPHIQ